MRRLFAPAGMRALASVLRKAPLLAFDFDGTLAPIVERPDDARVEPAVSQRLQGLARLRPVAVVTGRSVGDVARRLGFAPRYIVGNHGAEDPGQVCALDLARLDRVRAMLGARAGELRAAGVQVEDKRFSLALHYRLAPDPQRAVACIDGALGGLDPGLRRFGGKCVINVVLAEAPDKGEAVVSLVRRAGCSAAVFVGDDVNDEAVFARAAAGWLTVRVGRDAPRSRAAYFLDGHSDMEALLEGMLAMVEGRWAGVKSSDS